MLIKMLKILFNPPDVSGGKSPTLSGKNNVINISQKPSGGIS